MVATVLRRPYQLLLLLLATFAMSAVASVGPTQATTTAMPAASVVYGWNWLDYAFPTPEERAAYIGNKTYANIQPVGVRVHTRTGDMYLTTPRFHPTAPAMLVKVLAGTESQSQSGGPLLDAYPSWDANRLYGTGDATRQNLKLVSALGLVIDGYDRLWVIDNGKVFNGDPPVPPFPPQLVILDLNNGGALLHRHYFPESVAPLATSFLNDIAVDTWRQVAYISDSSDPTHGANAGVIVFDLATDTSRRVLGASYATQPDPNVNVTINGRDIGRPTAGCDSIALSPDLGTVYFSALTSHALYEIPTLILLDTTLSAAQAQASIRVSDMSRGFAADGIICDNATTLYQTSLDGSAIVASDASNPAIKTTIAFNPVNLTWPDTLAWDDRRGQLLVLSDGPIHFQPMDLSIVNFRVWAINVNAYSYSNSQAFGPLTPPSPNPSPASNATNRTLLALSIVFGVLLVVTCAAYIRSVSRSRRSADDGYVQSNP